MLQCNLEKLNAILGIVGDAHRYLLLIALLFNRDCIANTEKYCTVYLPLKVYTDNFANLLCLRSEIRV